MQFVGELKILRTDLNGNLMAKNIRSSTPPSSIGQPDIRLFRKGDFDYSIFSKGYDIIKERALRCPCEGQSGAPLTTCQNCLGTGFVFVNPIETKALITSINYQTKYKDWSPELTGTVSVTTRDEDKLFFMDRITFKTRNSVISELRDVRQSSNQKFIFTSYKIVSVLSVYLFDSISTKLIKVDPSNYAVSTNNSMILKLNLSSYPSGFNDVVSVEYEYNISYNVVDIPHDIRSTFLINEKGQNIEYNMPSQVIARRSHIVMNEPTNYGGTNLISNNEI